MVMKAQIRIGEVCISIEGDANIADWEIPPTYQPFIQPGRCDIKLRLHRGIGGNLTGKKVFDCPPIWTLYRQNGTSIIRVLDDLSGFERVLVFPPQVEKADLYFAERAGRFADPFYGPTMELLMVNYLAQGHHSRLWHCIERKGTPFCRRTRRREKYRGGNVGSRG